MANDNRARRDNTMVNGNRTKGQTFITKTKYWET
jgi:hypothetical protein